MKNEITDAILKEQIIVIVRNVEREKLIPMTEALYEVPIKNRYTAFLWE